MHSRPKYKIQREKTKLPLLDQQHEDRPTSYINCFSALAHLHPPICLFYFFPCTFIVGNTRYSVFLAFYYLILRVRKHLIAYSSHRGYPTPLPPTSKQTTKTLTILRRFFPNHLAYFFHSQPFSRYILPTLYLLFQREGENTIPHIT